MTPTGVVDTHNMEDDQSQGLAGLEQYEDGYPLVCNTGTSHDLIKSIEGSQMEDFTLQDHDICPESGDKYDQPSLISATRNGDKVLVERLLEEGGETEVQDTVGYTALHWAALRGDHHLVQLLLEYGSDLEVKDGCCARTPLFLAAGKGHKRVARLLAEKGAEIDVTDAHGLTLLCYTHRKGHSAVVRLLEALEDFCGQENGENESDWDGERGWKPVGSLRAVALYNKDPIQQHQVRSRFCEANKSVHLEPVQGFA
jgi:hypothetical protein